MNYPHAGYMQQIPYVWWSCRQSVKIIHAFLCAEVLGVHFVTLEEQYKIELSISVPCTLNCEYS